MVCSDYWYKFRNSIIMEHRLELERRGKEPSQVRFCNLDQYFENLFHPLNMENYVTCFQFRQLNVFFTIMKMRSNYQSVEIKCFKNYEIIFNNLYWINLEIILM